MENVLSNKELASLASSIRMMSLDSVMKAKSGHIGTPMGAADLMAVLFANHLNIDPTNPSWINRDRFILSAGHASAMLYSALHYLGFKEFSMDAMKSLRQLHAITSGHPEIDHNAGIEVTTGPLGQGVSMAVGSAISEQLLNKRYPDVIDHFTYALVGDGCLMEGVAYESLSLAGILKLNKLVVLYDKNSVTIDGTLEVSNIEDITKRMEATGFQVMEIDAHSYDEINETLENIKNNKNINQKPIFVICNSIIGKFIPRLQGKPDAHGFAMSYEDYEEVKKNLSWSVDSFDCPDNIKNIWESLKLKKSKLYDNWKQKLEGSKNKNKFTNEVLNNPILNAFDNDDFNEDLQKVIYDIKDYGKKLPTRSTSGEVLKLLTKYFSNNIVGGSADLSSSTNSINEYSKAITAKNKDGNYIHYGIREHAMGAIMSGISVYGGGFVPYAGTFLTFSDYVRPAIRLAALMKQQVIYIFTHDSINIGADGPTHQPIEHIESLNMIPNVEVLRPCDMIETIEAYQIALKNTTKPTILILGRSNVPMVRNNYDPKVSLTKFGGYIIDRAYKKEPIINLISSGSDLSMLMEAKKILDDKYDIICNVISMPSISRFAKQSEEYKNDILQNLINVVIEPKLIKGYKDVIGNNTYYYGLSDFGLSGSEDQLLKHFKFTLDDVVNYVVSLTK